VLLQTRVHDYPVDDGAVLVGRTAGGVLFSSHVAYNLPDAMPRRRLEVVGTSGQLTATDTMGQTAGGRLDYCSASTGTSLAVEFDGETSPFEQQVRAFGAAVRASRGMSLGPAWPYPIDRDLRLHRLLLSAADRAQVAEPSRSLKEPA
jgi:1,5-anhydro-D-fructose reductase (1,5-anhydro-D-mannitol-forming)